MESLAGAVVAAVVAAFLNAMAGFLQYRASKQVPGRRALQFRLLVELGRNPRWLAGGGCDLSALGLQVMALAFGPLVVVQPLLVTSLLMIVAIRGIAWRRSPRRGTWIGGLLTVGGLSTALIASSPTPGNPRAPFGLDVLLLAAGLAVVFSACLTVAMSTRRNRRGVALACAAGLLFGCTAGLAKVVTGQLTAGGILEVLQHWQVYVAVVFGISGAQLNQTAFQAGALAAPVAVLTVADPITSIAIGLVWLGEQVQTDPLSLAVEALALAAIVVGIALLARETPTVAREPGEDNSNHDAGASPSGSDTT